MATATGDAPPRTSPSAIQYEYMYEKDKSPTKQLDAILRAMARYISREIGDKADPELTPKKLAAFYKAVGGNYDSLFVKMDHNSISWIWQVTGCQHSLQPTASDFEPPSIPSLTARGFSRWEALEILLGPEEHVPFLQFAIKNWALEHPDTGEPFPPDLPRDVFPLEADREVDRWHEKCGDQLRKAAEEEEAPRAHEHKPMRPKPNPEQPEPKYAYVPGGNHSFPPQTRPHPRPDARSGQRSRPFSYVHVPGREQHPAQRPSPRSPERSYREPPPDDRGRRRSFSDYPSPTQERASPQGYSGTHLDPNDRRPPQGRRHSHPRHYSSDSSDDEPNAPPARRRPAQSPPLANRRYAPPSAPQPPSAVNGRPRPELRESDLKRRNGNSPLGSIRNKVSETVSGIFGSSRPERPRNDSKQNSYIESPRARRSPQRVHSTRVAPSPAYVESASDDSSDSDSSEDDAPRRRGPRPRDDRDRNTYRDRVRPYEPDREYDDDLDQGPRRNRQYMRRPEAHRRTSSHADVDRRRDQQVFDPRGRDRIRDERRRYDRRSPDDRESTSPMTGVSGRRYAPDPVYT